MYDKTDKERSVSLKSSDILQRSLKNKDVNIFDMPDPDRENKAGYLICLIKN